MGLWYPKDSGFELIAYSDADHVGCKDDCKSTSGDIQFLGDKLVDWSSKKQDCTTMSIAEDEYVSLSACVFSTNNLSLDWISAYNFLTRLQKLSSYASGHLKVFELAACLEKASFSNTSDHDEVF
ncbi:hypothetical protein Tco_0111281 [Tanacetum coccineum]